MGGCSMGSNLQHVGKYSIFWKWLSNLANQWPINWLQKKSKCYTSHEGMLGKVIQIVTILYMISKIKMSHQPKSRNFARFPHKQDCVRIFARHWLERICDNLMMILNITWVSMRVKIHVTLSFLYFSEFFQEF